MYRKKFIYLLSNNSSSTTFISDAPVRNLGVTFYPHLSFSNPISNLPRSCFMHIRDLRRIRPMLDFKTASHHCHLHRPLKTRLLQLPLSQPRLHPNTASTAHPKLTRTRCHQNAPASSYHSCP